MEKFIEREHAWPIRLLFLHDQLRPVVLTQVPKLVDQEHLQVRLPLPLNLVEVIQLLIVSFLLLLELLIVSVRRSRILRRLVVLELVTLALLASFESIRLLNIWRSQIIVTLHIN